MPRCTVTLTLLVLLGSGTAHAQTLQISRSGSREVRPGPAQNFTGSVRVEMLFEARDPSHASGIPEARS
jgi:4-carboxymuconolactone decarboxylase